jgi:ribosomal protein S6
LLFTNNLPKEAKMQENGLDINIVIEVFKEKIAQLTNDLLVKEAIIRQLNMNLALALESQNKKETKKEV